MKNYSYKKLVILIVVLLSLVIILLNMGCVTPPARVEYMETPEYFEFDDFGMQIWHYNDRGNITGPLNWADARALKIDSVTAQYVQYRRHYYK